jgi:hypothetical protein
MTMASKSGCGTLAAYRSHVSQPAAQFDPFLIPVSGCRVKRGGLDLVSCHPFT